MIATATNLVGRDVMRREERLKASAERLLSLAAAPTFAAMALLTAIPNDGAAAMLCSAAHNSSPLTGMEAMYLLMSAFHLTPWLRLLSRRPGGVGRP